MREPVGEVAPLGCDRVRQGQAEVAHHAKVTGGRDCKTVSLASVSCNVFQLVASHSIEFPACL